MWRNSPNADIESSDNDLRHVFPILMFKKGSIKREDTVVDIDKLLKYFMGCNKKIVFLINNYDEYHCLLLSLYVNSLKYEYDINKFKKLHLDAVVELEETLMLIQEILTDSLFTYLDNLYNKMVDNVLYDDYKFDICLKFTTMKNAGELRIFDFIKEKREAIMSLITLEFYKAKKILKIKYSGDDI